MFRAIGIFIVSTMHAVVEWWNVAHARLPQASRRIEGCGYRYPWNALLYRATQEREPGSAVTSTPNATVIRTWHVTLTTKTDMVSAKHFFKAGVCQARDGFRRVRIVQ